MAAILVGRYKYPTLHVLCAGPGKQPCRQLTVRFTQILNEAFPYPSTLGKTLSLSLYLVKGCAGNKIEFYPYSDISLPRGMLGVHGFSWFQSWSGLVNSLQCIRTRFSDRSGQPAALVDSTPPPGRLNQGCAWGVANSALDGSQILLITRFTITRPCPRIYNLLPNLLKVSLCSFFQSRIFPIRLTYKVHLNSELAR